MTTADDRPIILVATFDATPDTVDELRRRLLELEVLSNQEDGCEQYELHCNDEHPLRFSFIETWSSDAALAAHDQTDHVKAIRGDIPRLTAHPVDIQRLRRVGA
jgi:quinol monooxygenase YgiN